MMIDTDMTSLRAVFQLGYDAHEDGLPVTVCPENLTPEDRETWQEGWYTAQGDLRLLEDELMHKRWDEDDLRDWDD